MAARRPGGARYGVFLLLFGGMQLKIAHPLPLLDFARSPRQLFTFLSGLKKLLTRVGRVGAPHQSSGTLTAAWARENAQERVIKADQLASLIAK